MTQPLDDRLLDAHARNDTPALVQLYQEAAEQADDENAAAFFLTHAYVLALEIGSPNANALRSELVRMGRETQL